MLMYGKAILVDFTYKKAMPDFTYAEATPARHQHYLAHIHVQGGRCHGLQQQHLNRAHRPALLGEGWRSPNIRDGLIGDAQNLERARTAALVGRG